MLNQKINKKLHTQFSNHIEYFEYEDGKYVKKYYFEDENENEILYEMYLKEMEEDSLYDQREYEMWLKEREESSLYDDLEYEMYLKEMEEASFFDQLEYEIWLKEGAESSLYDELECEMYLKEMEEASYFDELEYEIWLKERAGSSHYDEEDWQYGNATEIELENIHEETLSKQYKRKKTQSELLKPNRENELKLENSIHQKKYKKRLIVGEGGFSYIKSLIKKHEKDMPDLAKAITATEYQSRESLCRTNGVSENIKFVEERGVSTEFGVDATNLGKYANKSIKRIHFNCPYINNAESTVKLVSNFFQSAKTIQNKGDRIHMALVDTEDKYHQIKYYNIVEASSSAGYEILKKREFGDKRYCGYTHRTTTGGNNHSYQGQNDSKEFIFEKTDKSSKIIKEGKRQFIGKKNNSYFFKMDSEEDSSSYEDSSSEIPKNNREFEYNKK